MLSCVRSVAIVVAALEVAAPVLETPGVCARTVVHPRIKSATALAPTVLARHVPTAPIVSKVSI